MNISINLQENLKNILFRKLDDTSSLGRLRTGTGHRAGSELLLDRLEIVVIAGSRVIGPICSRLKPERDLPHLLH